MSNYAGTVASQILLQMKENGYNGVSNIAIAVGTVATYYNALKTDYQNGDYGALAVDSLLVAGTGATTASILLLGSGAIFAFGLEGAVAAVAFIAIAAAAGEAGNIYNGWLKEDAARLAAGLDLAAKALAEASSDALNVILEDIRSQLADMINRFEDGYYTDRIGEVPDNRSIGAKAWDATTVHGVVFVVFSPRPAIATTASRMRSRPSPPACCRWRPGA